MIVCPCTGSIGDMSICCVSHQPSNNVLDVHGNSSSGGSYTVSSQHSQELRRCNPSRVPACTRTRTNLPHSVICSSQDGIPALLSNSSVSSNFVLMSLMSLQHPDLCSGGYACPCLPIACPLLALSKLSINASQCKSLCLTTTHCSCHEFSCECEHQL